VCAKAASGRNEVPRLISMSLIFIDTTNATLRTHNINSNSVRVVSLCPKSTMLASPKSLVRASRA